MTEHVEHDAAALYVVDALSTDEARAFEIHLAGCTECQAEVVELRALTEGLSRSVEAEPPPSLRTTLLAQIATTEQEPAPVVSVDQATPGEGDERLAEVVLFRSRRARRVAVLVAAAAVLVATGFGIWGVQSRNNAQRASDREAQLVNLLGAGDVQTVSGAVSGGGTGTVVLSQSRDQAVFVSAGLPAPPSGHVYQLWTITDKPVSAGTFTPTGNGATVTPLPDAALSAGQIAMTVEPTGGSAQPTTNPVLAVAVPPSG